MRAAGGLWLHSSRRKLHLGECGFPPLMVMFELKFDKTLKTVIIVVWIESKWRCKWLEKKTMV